jgi:hypothetical protein
VRTKLVAFSLFVVLGLSLALPPSFESTSAAQGLVPYPSPRDIHWWPANGTTADITGGLDAELRDGATFGEGFIKQAFYLDGESDFVEVPSCPELNLGTGDFTVHLWVYFDDLDDPDDREQVLVEKWVQGESISTGWTLTKLQGNILRLALDDGQQDEIDVDSGLLTIDTETWYHFAATRKGGQVAVYMNGEPVAEGTADLNLDSESSLKFGHRGDPDHRWFDLAGRIDEVQLYVGLALPGPAIQAIYVAGNARQH